MRNVQRCSIIFACFVQAWLLSGQQEQCMRYVTITPEAIAVLGELHGQQKDDESSVLAKVVLASQKGLVFHPWADVIEALTCACDLANDQQVIVLQCYKDALYAQAETGDTIPVTFATRAFNCLAGVTCSGVAPDFTADSVILQAVQAQCTGIESACQGICSGGIIVPTSCIAPTAACQALVSGLSLFCPALEASLDADCQTLSGLCQGDPFFGVVPFDPGSFTGCSAVPLPATAIVPVLPNIPANGKILMCDFRVTNFEAENAIIGELGVSQDLNVIGSGIFGGNLDVGGDITVDGSLDVGSGVVAAGGLELNGNATVSGALCANGPVTASDSLAVQGPVTLYSSLGVSGAIVSNGDLTVAGSVNALSGIVASGPVCANDLVAERASIDAACIQQAQIEGLRVVTACINEASISGLAANLICVQDIVIENCLNFDQLAVDQAVIGGLATSDALIDRICVGTACITDASIDQLESNTACVGTMYVDLLGAQTGCFQNVDVCQLLLQDLFIENTIHFNGGASAICGLPQGFGEILFVARDFCQPLCLSVVPLLSSGCNDVMAFNTVVYPYNFSTSCAPQEVICGVPVPQCSGTSNVAYLPHVDLVIPQDYNNDFALDVYLLAAPGTLFPTGVYELRSQIVHIPVAECATVALNGNVPFSITAVCDTFGSTSVLSEPGLTRFTLHPDVSQAAMLEGGDWARIALDLSAAPTGLSGCRPLISAMVFRYARQDLADAFSVFPG